MTDTALPRTFTADVDAHGSAVGESRPIPFATRPVLQGTLGMVAAGHYLAAALRNPSAAQGQFGNLIFGFAVTEALGIFSLLIALLLLFAL